MKRMQVFPVQITVLIGALVLAGMAGECGAQVTHKPFVEFAAKTTCPYCKYAHQALRELDVQRQNKFHFVSLVCNMNSTAYGRAKYDYNFYGYPTVYFDGGYLVSLGAGSAPSAKSTYNFNLGQCEARSVANLDLSLDVQWIGKAKMDISASVKNNGPTPYSGRIRIYITEIKSSLGWRDTGGHPYAYAFLDFAMNQFLSISSGKRQDLSVQWDGGMKGYGGITYDNIMVFAAVFNGTGRTGYSYPPYGYPFTAYWVDASESARPSPLASDTRFFSQYGGTVKFGLYAYYQNAYRPYLLGGSITGTSPGTPMPGGPVTLPLNLDAFTVYVLLNLNTPMFANFMGALDYRGTATATLNAPAIPGTVGVKLYFAYVLRDKFNYVSNPVTIEIR